MKEFFLSERFFICLGIISLIMALSFVEPIMMNVAVLLLILLVIATIYQMITIAPSRKSISVQRLIPSRYALGDQQEINYKIINDSSNSINIELVDELPYQLQIRDYSIKERIEGLSEKSVKFDIRPLTRGVYTFGAIHVFFQKNTFSLLQWRKTIESKSDVAVVPSFLQMRKFDLEVFSNSAMIKGLKKVRRLGQNDEFEHIKHYEKGDDIKMINWKASARRNEFMVNQYQDTQSQSVYVIIDKGRSMKTPFDGLTLLEHSINSALVLSNIVLKRMDRMGLITIGSTIDTWIKQHNRKSQLMRISDALYAETTSYGETDIKNLYYFVRQRISRRSCFFLYTNFEHRYDMERALPYLIKLNRLHVLVVIIFTNRGLYELGIKPAEEYNDIYTSTIAMNKVVEKEKIANELSTYGIKVITTLPEDLNINVINKYLELKARRLT